MFSLYPCCGYIKMFNLEIEKKIVGFIKGSPIGVTSSDIAKYIGLNRMTITKYLAIIKEKALIDFKPFGMAKLWYIPINLNKETFLSRIMVNLTINIPKEESKSLFEKVGISLGEEINQMYSGFYDVERLSLDQVLDAYMDIGKKLGGSFRTKLGNENISVEIIQSPFKIDSNAINTILASIFAKIASLNLPGYEKSIVSEPKENGNVVIDIYVKKGDNNGLKP